MSTQLLLKQYKKDVNNLRNNSKNLGLSEKEINEVFHKFFSNVQKENVSSVLLDNKQPKAQNGIKYTIKIFLILSLFLVFVYILLNVHQTTSSIVLRNVQGLTYPTLRIIRILSVPIINLFPSLTDLYDESCLLENPFFYVPDMECWPCENVHSVIDLTTTTTESDIRKAGSGTPFVFKVNQSDVTMDALKEFYYSNEEVLNQDSRRLKSTDSNISTLKDLFDSSLNSSSNLHIQWRINKMSSSKLIRKLFPRPSLISERSGQSVERYVMIDKPKAGAYILPSTECSYVLIVQGSGERTIVLRPSKECSNNCRTISVLMKPSHALWYNWWYWRPISLPTKNSASFSVSYINSYC